MKKINKKGFTLVELLAVIVVLAIIMIFAIPAVLGAMDNARLKSFQIYAEKVMNATQAQYQNDILMNTLTDKKQTATGVTAAYCYNLSDLGLTSTGSYRGYVVVTEANNKSDVNYYVTLSDNNYYIQKYSYAKVENLTVKGTTIPEASTATTINCERATSWTLPTP